MPGSWNFPKRKRCPPMQKRSPLSGPDRLGLTAAGDLADRGYAVTLYEATDQAGGMLAWGIPQYRLPKDILAYEVELIRARVSSWFSTPPWAGTSPSLS